MPTEKRRQGCYGDRLSTKAAYLKAAHHKLAETREKIDGVNASIVSAISNGRIEPNGRLETARRAIEVSVAIAEVRLDQLEKSGEDEWQAVSVEVESAWEDVSRSISRLVSSIAD